MAWTANRRLYWTGDKRRVVEEGDPDAAFLFRAKGQSISDVDMRQYGIDAIRKPAGRRKNSMPAAENKASTPPGEDKLASPAAGDKIAPDLFETFEDRRIVETLVGAGFDTPEKVRAASDDVLRAVDGIGPKTLVAIREALG